MTTLDASTRRRPQLLFELSSIAIADASALRSSALLDGWRGAPAANQAAIVDAMLAADLMTSQPQPDELDINPLRCSERGALALDALMIWNDTP